MSGERLVEIIAGLLGTPQDVRERVKAALQPKDENTLKGILNEPK